MVRGLSADQNNGPTQTSMWRGRCCRCLCSAPQCIILQGETADGGEGASPKYLSYAAMRILLTSLESEIHVPAHQVYIFAYFTVNFHGRGNSKLVGRPPRRDVAGYSHLRAKVPSRPRPLVKCFRRIDTTTRGCSVAYVYDIPVVPKAEGVPTIEVVQPPELRSGGCKRGCIESGDT